MYQDFKKDEPETSLRKRVAAQIPVQPKLHSDEPRVDVECIHSHLRYPLAPRLDGDPPVDEIGRFIERSNGWEKYAFRSPAVDAAQDSRIVVRYDSP